MQHKMNFSNEQTYAGRDIVEIPAISKKALNLIFLAMIPVVSVLFAWLMMMLDLSKFGIWLICVLVMFVCCGFFLAEKLAFSFCKKKKVEFEFTAENFIYNGKAIKWADMQKISYIWSGSGKSRHISHISVYYENTVAGTNFKVHSIMEIAENITLKISLSKVKKLIADKFYHYYGSLHGVMLKKRFFWSCYKLTPISRKDALQNANSSNQLPKIFK